MTRPENFRRRQRAELALVLVIMAGSIVYAFFDDARDQDRRDCLVTTVEQLRDYQAVRDELNDSATKLRNRAQELQVLSNDIQSDLIRDVFEAQDQNDVTSAFVRFDRRDKKWEAANARLSARIKTNLEQREKIEVPPFLSGRCDSIYGKDDLT